MAAPLRYKLDKQSEIERFLSEQENYTSTLNKIADGVPWGYYHNSHKYIGEILGRMVKNGKVKRIRKGVYKWVPPPRMRRKPPVWSNENQTSLEI